MCLNRVLEIGKQTCETRLIGFKVMYKDRKGERFECRYYTSMIRKRGQTYSSTRTFVCAERDYPTGFHIYESFSDAKKSLNGNSSLVVVAVEYWDVVAQGIEHHAKDRINVARKMRILGEVR